MGSGVPRDGRSEEWLHELPPDNFVGDADRALSFLVVCLGGALGSGARYPVALFAVSRGWTASPWATLFVNVVGCFFITFVMAIAAAFTMRENLRLFLTTGIMGGLTTYSTFDLEATNFLRAGESSSAFLYIGLTLVLCFCSGLLGLAVARLVA